MSRSWRPADETASGDKRHLGVCVAEIEIDSQIQTLAALGAGWHPLESNDGREWRWTDGSASLSAGQRISVWLGGEPLYWVEAEAETACARRPDAVRASDAEPRLFTIAALFASLFRSQGAVKKRFGA